MRRIMAEVAAAVSRDELQPRMAFSSTPPKTMCASATVVSSGLPMTLVRKCSVRRLVSGKNRSGAER